MLHKCLSRVIGAVDNSLDVLLDLNIHTTLCFAHALFGYGYGEGYKCTSVTVVLYYYYSSATIVF